MVQSTRRRALASAAGLIGTGLAGCLTFGDGGPWYELQLDGPTDTLTALVVTPAAAQSADQRAALQSAVAATNNTTTTYGWEPFEDGGYVAHDGAYYRVSVTETDRTVTHDRRVVYGEPVNESVATDAVNLSAFPRRDYRALKHVVASRVTDDDKATDDTRVLHNATSNNSALVPEPTHEYLQHDGAYYRILVETQTVTEGVVELSTERVADSQSAFESYARSTLLDGNLSSPPLSGNTQSIVTTATTEGYDEEVPLSEAFITVLHRCGYEATADGVTTHEGDRTRYVAYDGQYYAAEVLKAVA